MKDVLIINYPQCISTRDVVTCVEIYVPSVVFQNGEPL